MIEGYPSLCENCRHTWDREFLDSVPCPVCGQHTTAGDLHLGDGVILQQLWTPAGYVPLRTVRFALLRIVANDSSEEGKDHA